MPKPQPQDIRTVSGCPHDSSAVRRGNLIVGPANAQRHALNGMKRGSALNIVQTYQLYNISNLSGKYIYISPTTRKFMLHCNKRRINFLQETLSYMFFPDIL
jgi:hypothetical protein